MSTSCAPGCASSRPGSRSPTSSRSARRQHDDDSGDRRGRRRDVRRLRAPAAARHRRLSDEERASAARRRRSATLLPTVTTLVAAPLPERAARGRAGAPRARRRRPRARGRGRASRAGNDERRRDDPGARRRTVRLPQGDEKRRAVEAMFDRVAPDYERVNRVISLGPRSSLAGPYGRGARARPSRARVLDLACGTGDLARDVERDGPRRRRRRPLGRDAPGRAHGRLRSSAATPPRSRSQPDRSTASSAASRCGTSSTSRRCSPRSRGCCAPVGASPRSTPRCPSTRSCEPATRSGSAARCPCSAGSSRATPRPTATSHDRPRYLPDAGSARRGARRRRLPRLRPGDDDRRIGPAPDGSPDA